MKRSAAATRRSLGLLMLLTTAVALLSSVPAAGAATSAAVAARVEPRALASAATSTRKADRALVLDAKSLKRCRARKQTSSCAAESRALQRAGKTYAARERRLTTLAGADGSARSSSSRGSEKAPKLSVSGTELSWKRIAGASAYIVVRHVPGQPAQDVLVDDEDYTPPPVPGVTVAYAVRTTTRGSSWSNEVSISYPAPSKAKAGESAPDTQAAPKLEVSGQALSWNAIAGVSTYVLDTKVAGQADQYSEVSGTSYAPAAQTGKTVRYSLRTAVEGSAWSTEVAISYAAAAAPPSSTPPSEEVETTPPAGSSSDSNFEPGLNSGYDPTYDIPGAAELGAKVVRLDLGIEESPKQFESTIAAYAAKGIRVAPLADFTGTMPSAAEAQNLASWASTYGPGGTFWAHRSDGQLAIHTIEFGNETSYSWQYSNDTPSGYASRAETYALRFAEAAKAIKAANPSVGLLAQGDAGNAGSIWVEHMFKAVPNLGSLVAGWTIHPYGPSWKTRFQTLISQTAAAGAPSSIPIDVTEWGLATDNGACLTENYGWNRCMSYQEAGEVLTRTVSEMRSTLGERMGMFMLYQVRDQQKPNASDEREAYFGAVEHELQPKGNYTAAAKTLMES